MKRMKACLLLIGLVAMWGGMAYASGPGPVGTEFTYQGMLTDGGLPANGNYDLRFFLYDREAGGFQVGAEVLLSGVSVNNGLIQVELDFGANAFTGAAVWLEIGVRPGGSGSAYTVLSPRQPLTPSPYAVYALEAGLVSWDGVSGLIGMGPQQLAEGSHAHFGQIWSGSGLRGLEILNTLNNANATALRGQKTVTGAAVRGDAEGGYGVYGYSLNVGVYGESASATPGTGYGGYFVSSSGVGAYGRSAAIPSVQNLYAPGVHGVSERGVGVMGEGLDPSFPIGVLGRAATGYAVLGDGGGGRGVYGFGEHGVFGMSRPGLPQGRGYGGYFTSGTGIGVEGRSTALSSLQNLYAPGVFGFSEHGVGVMGRKGSSGGSVAGFFDGPVIVQGNLTVTGSKSGYVVDVAVNDGPLPLERGDLVVVTGYGEPVVGNIPLVRVRKAETADSRAVVGVVDEAYRAPALGGLPNAQPESSSDDGIEEGQLLTIVTLGAFQAIKVDASHGAIQAGDLLVTSSTSGHAMRSDNPRIGTVVGKAMADWAEGAGTIPVMVTLH